MMSTRRRMVAVVLGALAVAPRARAGLFAFRIHELARYTTRDGPVLRLVLRGEVWKLTDADRTFIQDTARRMCELDRVKRVCTREH